MISKNTIFNEDCFDTMSRMDDGEVDIILTSPPYNMTKRKGGYADTGRYDVYQDWKTEEEYIGFTTKLFNEFARVVKPEGTVLYNFGYSIENPSLPYKLVASIVNDTDWYIVDTICWKKSSGLPFPANQYRLSRNWEFVWVFCKKSHIDNFFIDKGVASVSEKTGQKYYNVYYNFIEARNNDEKTPKLNQATFSSELVVKLLTISGGNGNNFVVYDPFMGTGTTAVGCVECPKQPSYIGSEISKNQVEYSKERLEKCIATRKNTFVQDVEKHST